MRPGVNGVRLASDYLIRTGSVLEEVKTATSRVEKRQVCLHSDRHYGRASRNSQGMTHMIPQWGSATGAIVIRQIAGGTDLAFAKPGTRFTTMPYNRKVLGHIIGQGYPNLGPVERPS